MRISFFLLVLTAFLGLILWVTLSGALFILGALLFLFFIVITVGYSDTAILYFLGAREIKSRDEEDFHTAAVQEAYKLAVPIPRLYFYNGSLERGFILQNRSSVSIVLSKELLKMCNREELSAICFELLFQVKKGLAVKRTKVMFIIGLISWLFHTLTSVILSLIPIKEVRQTTDWFVGYVVNPWLDLLFSFTLGDKYFRKIQNYLADYPLEQDMLSKVGAKLRKPMEARSLPSRKLIEIAALGKNRHYQSILSLEFLPHEWDVMFDRKVEASV